MQVKKDNRGLSIIEVVIVITILAILGALMTAGISAAVSKPADECANKMVAAFNNARVTTMGKQKIQLLIYEENSCVYLKKMIYSTKNDGTVNVDTQTTKIGAKDVKVTYKVQGDSSEIFLNGNPMQITFLRTTGGFNKLPAQNAYLEEIIIKKGGKTRTIKVSYLTGKVVLE